MGARCQNSLPARWHGCRILHSLAPGFLHRNPVAWDTEALDCTGLLLVRCTLLFPTPPCISTLVSSHTPCCCSSLRDCYLLYLLMLCYDTACPCPCVGWSPLNGSFSIAGNACDLLFYLQHLTKLSLWPWSLGNLCRTEVNRIRGSRHTLCFLCNSNRY